MKTKTLNLSFLKPLLLVACVVMCCGNAWGGSSRYFAKAIVKTNPEGIGNGVAYAETEVSHFTKDDGLYTFSSYQSMEYTLKTNPPKGYWVLGWTSNPSSYNNYTPINITTSTTTNEWTVTLYGKKVSGISNIDDAKKATSEAKEYTLTANFAQLYCDEPGTFYPSGDDATQTLTVSRYKVGEVSLDIIGTDAGAFDVNKKKISTSDASAQQTEDIVITYDPTRIASTHPALYDEHTAQLVLTSTTNDYNGSPITYTINLLGDGREVRFQWAGTDGNIVAPGTYVSNFITVVDKTNSSVVTGMTLDLQSSNEDTITVDDTNNTMAVNGTEGQTATIIASVDAYGIYKAHTEQKDLTITGKSKQYIDWGQTFSYNIDKTNNRTIPLTGVAKNRNTDATIPEANISYELSNITNGVVSLSSDGKSLIINQNKVGTAIITAHSDAMGDDYLAAEDVIKTIRISSDTECNTKIIDWGTTTHNIDESSSYLLQDINKNAPCDEISFKLTSSSLKDNYYSVSIIEYSDNQGTKQLVAHTDIEGAKSLNYTSNFKLNTNTQSVRFSIARLYDNNKHTVTIKELTVSQQSYLRANDFNGQAYLNVVNSFNIPVEYSDKQDAKVSHTNNNIQIGLPQDEDDYYLLEDIDCGKYGTTYIPLVIKPTTAGTITDQLTITTYDGSTVTINVTINVKTGDTFYFVQNPSGEWSNPEHWSLSSHGTPQSSTGKLPNASNPVVIQGMAEITDDTWDVLSLTMDGGTLRIDGGAGLTVYSGTLSTVNSTNLTLGSCKDKGNGYIRAPKGTTAPTANVELFTKAYYDVNGAENSATWQYIGSPLTQASCPQAQNLFYGDWLYEYDPSTRVWSSVDNTHQMEPFCGYTLTQDDAEGGKIYTFTGQLNAFNDATYSTTSLASGKSTCVANSYPAPIYVAGFTEADFVGFDPTIYLFNTGSYDDWINASVTSITDVNIKEISDLQNMTPGSYISIPVNSAKLSNELRMLTIPSMQGFSVFAKKDNTATRTINFDYNRLVWHQGENPYVLPMFAPAQYADNQTNITKPQSEDELTARIEMMVIGDGQMDMLCLLEAPGFDDTYEPGYDGKKKFPSKSVPFIYTNEAAGGMMVSAIDDLDGMVLGFDTPDRDNDTILTYTLSFFSILGEEYYLHDNLTNLDVLMTEGATYTFTAPASTENLARFTIGSTPRGTVTEIDEELNDSDIRIWQRGEQVCASVNSNAKQTLTLCDMQGHMIASVPFVSTCTYDMSYLPAGVYTATVGNQTVKVVR